MKAGSRPQYYRTRRMVQMVREGTHSDYLPNSSDFMAEFDVSRRTVARDLNFLRDEERAPLEYDEVRHADLDAFRPVMKRHRPFLFSTKGKKPYTDVAYRPGDLLVFGSETRGLPESLLAEYPDAVVTVPMATEHVRSLNLSNTVAIALYEALRQSGAEGMVE